LTPPAAAQLVWRRGTHRVSATAVSSERAAATSSSSHNRDALIVGPGVLGTAIACDWLRAFPGAVVVGQTNTTNSHVGLTKSGMHARVKDFKKDDASANRVFDYVVFSAPPSGSEDYPAEVAAALKYWSGKGSFVFTSSSAVYANETGEACDEDSAIYEIGTNPRVDRLLRAERVVLDAGGVVCRLAGLYHSERGAHKYFLKTPTLDSRADALVNLIHYEDAASLCVAALATDSKSTIFLGTDGVPVTRGAIAKLTLESGAYPDGVEPVFTKTDGPLGREMSNAHTRARLHWTPKYESFEAFMTTHGAIDTYSPRYAPTRARFIPTGRPHLG
jgi:nucleoside-diphosphate-sugar epimerase